VCLLGMRPVGSSSAAACMASHSLPCCQAVLAAPLSCASSSSIKQASLAKLRSDYEASQTQLVETLSRLDAVQGAAHAAEDMEALDEADRLRRQMEQLSSQRAALQAHVEQLRKEREQQQQQQQQQQQHVHELTEQEGSAGSSSAAAAHGVLSPRAGAFGVVRDTERLQVRAEEAAAQLRDLEHQNRLLESRVRVAEAQVTRLLAEVERRPTAKQHGEAVAAVSALSSLLGRQLEAEGWEGSAATAAVAALTADPGQLQSQLQERASRLSDALTAAGREAESLKAERNAAQRAASQAAAQLAEARAAIVQLEADLAVATAAAGADGSRNAAGINGGNGSSEALPNLEDAGVPPSALMRSASGAAAVAADASSSGGGLLSVVVRQRDRFAARIEGLEEEAAQARAQAALLTSQVERLTADNVALVGQIRYLKQQQVGNSAVVGVGGRAAGLAGGSTGATVIRVDSAGVVQAEAKAARYSCGPVAFEVAGRRRRQRATVAAAAGGHETAAGPEARYVHHYERALNPFANFKSAEAESRVRALRLHDRLLYAAGSIIADSAAARAGVFLYLLLLHAYIMLMLYARASPTNTTGFGVGAGNSGSITRLLIPNNTTVGTS
jgi:hypothetical protein